MSRQGSDTAVRAEVTPPGRRRSRFWTRIRVPVGWMAFLWREGRLRALARPPVRERNSRRHRAWVACQLSLSFVMAYIGARMMLNLMMPGLPAPASHYLPVVLAAATVPLMQRLSPLSDHFDDDEFCRCYAIVVRLVRGLTENAGSADALPGFAESLARHLRLSHAEIRLRGSGDTAAKVVSTWGRPRGRIRRRALSYLGEQIGELVMSRRRDRRFKAEDRVLLDELARELAVAAHVLRTTEDLRRSRARLMQAREEERRRICRDLHDGVGPVLATVTMRVDAARVMLGDKPAAADAVLAQLQIETKSAVAKVREMIHELRPAMAFEGGLARATRKQAVQLERASGGHPTIRVDVQPDMPRLSPSVELAAYRIASEAMTNVVKHADAQECIVRMHVGEDLLIEVLDDGVGPWSPPHKGLGLTFMQERARELGGVCTVGPRRPFGTRIAARLPVR
jgi:two-component system NarL family sensor kinase